MKNIKESLIELFTEKFKNKPGQIKMLPGSGSDRKYFRLYSNNISFIGAYNNNIKENEAFFSFTETFRKLKINVPEIIAIASDRCHYLLSDLGDDTLFKLISDNKKTKTGNHYLCLVKESLLQLIQIQLKGGKHIDFSKCYPRASFDKQSIQWDLNYFKYEFLKLANISFDEQNLEDDFNTLADYLLETPSNYFMFRDFQSRNIMIVNDIPFFIDYQGGRKGPLQYDLASIIYSPKTNLNSAQKEAILDFYLMHLEKHLEVNKTEFKNQYYGFVLIRILQALGAYGFRGLYEKKANFRNSIPAAIRNIKSLFDNNFIPIALPEIERLINNLAASKWNVSFKTDENILTLSVTSFSYKNGIPDDLSENGGGFVFDCRGLPNPGRYAEYKTMSGKDKEVVSYLENYNEVALFQNHVREILRISIEEYLRRGFNHLSVNFGCTGGQHRSVYNAEKFCIWAENNFNVKVVLVHKEQKNWKKDEQGM